VSSLTNALSLAFLLVAVPVSAQLAAPPAGTWAQIPNTAIYPVMPIEGKSSSAPGGQPELWNPAHVFAYSGGALVTLNGVVGFLYWGGGHAATPDNSLYWAPFDRSGPIRLTGPYLAPDRVYNYGDSDKLGPWEMYRSVSRNAPPTVTAAEAPKSRHTYSSLVLVEVRGKLYLWCYGGSLFVGSGGGTQVTRMFDLSLTYSQAMARPDMGWQRMADAPAGSVASSSGWDRARKRVVTRGKSFWGAYYVEENRWERWGDAVGGSDYAAGVAMDGAGRKMYVLGERLAEVCDLDTHVVTPITAPWAELFRKAPWSGGYPTGPGIDWHDRTRQIVAWVGGNNLLLIDPKTGTSRTVIMGGVQVSAAEGSGTFGRFRVIPGTDLVVLVNSVNENVFIGSVPFDTRASSEPSPATKILTVNALPLPPKAAPSETGQTKALSPGITLVTDATTLAPAQTPVPVPTPSEIPLRTWIERPLLGWGGIGKSYMPTGGKHGRTFYHPGLKQMIYAGGDWKTAQPNNDGSFVGSEIWALDVANDKWTQLRPFCVPSAVQPGRPDNVVWAYDSKRDRGLMAPGFYAITQGANSGCGAREGWGAYAFDFSTKQFVGPDDAAGLPAPPLGGAGGQTWGGDEGGAWGVYDSINDELVRVRNGMRLERLNLATKTWNVQNLSDPGGTTPHRSQQVVDVKGRAVFFLAPWRKPPSLIRVSLKNGSVTAIPLPQQYRLPDTGGTEDYLVFDNINRVVLLPNNFGMGQTPIQGLGVFHVDSGKWEWEAVPPVVVASVWGFDELVGAMVGIGKRYEPFAYFIYKYDPTAQAPNPPVTKRWMPAVQTPAPSPPSHNASFLEDNINRSNVWTFWLK
jgi:hypothetical protein